MGCQLRDFRRCPVPRQEVFPEESKPTFYISLNLRDYPASATCLKIKNIPVPELSICFASRTLPQGQQVFSWGRYVPRNNYPRGLLREDESLAQNIAGRGTGRERREGDGDGMVPLSPKPPWTLRTSRKCQEDKRPPEPMGVRLISPSSNFHCSTAQWMMTTTSKDYVTAEMMLNTGTEDAGITCVWVASPPEVLLGLMYLPEPAASGRWASDIRGQIPGLCSGCPRSSPVSGLQEVPIMRARFLVLLFPFMPGVREDPAAVRTNASRPFSVFPCFIGLQTQLHLSRQYSQPPEVAVSGDVFSGTSPSGVSSSWVSFFSVFPSSVEGNLNLWLR